MPSPGASRYEPLRPLTASTSASPWIDAGAGDLDGVLPGESTGHSTLEDMPRPILGVADQQLRPIDQMTGTLRAAGE